MRLDLSCWISYLARVKSEVDIERHRSTLVTSAVKVSKQLGDLSYKVLNDCSKHFSCEGRGLNHTQWLKGIAKTEQTLGAEVNKVSCCKSGHCQ